MFDDDTVLLIVAQFIRETQQRVHSTIAASQQGEAFDGGVPALSSHRGPVLPARTNTASH